MALGDHTGDGGDNVNIGKRVREVIGVPTPAKREEPQPVKVEPRPDREPVPV